MTNNQVNRRMNILRFIFLFVYFLTSNWTSLDRTVIAQRLPLVINTWRFTEATKAGWKALNKRNANVFDAVEVGCSTCEKIQCDGSVGFGSHPDEGGKVTLDAMIMDGKTQNVGSVASMSSIKNAISVARKVLEHSKHSLLVGDAATQFATKFGFKIESLETENSNRQHNEWLENNCQPNFWTNMIPDPLSACGPYRPNSERNQLDDTDYTVELDVHSHDTIGMIAIDVNGEIAVGSSTNGANHKIPGRVGDTAIPGSGGFADNKFGAAVSTGDGDIIMRFSPAALAVNYLEQNNTPSDAAELVLKKIYEKYPKNQAAIVVVNKDGDFGAACFNMGEFPFSFITNEMDEVQINYVDCLEKKMNILD